MFRIEPNRSQTRKLDWSAEFSKGFLKRSCWRGVVWNLTFVTQMIAAVHVSKVSRCDLVTEEEIVFASASGRASQFSTQQQFSLLTDPLGSPYFACIKRSHRISCLARKSQRRSRRREQQNRRDRPETLKSYYCTLSLDWAQSELADGGK